jgi:hypothetical protein
VAKQPDDAKWLKKPDAQRAELSVQPDKPPKIKNHCKAQWFFMVFKRLF